MSEPVQAFPTDLALVLGLLAVLNVVLRDPGLREAAIAGARVQPLIAIPTVLLLPGYVLVAIFFPRRSERTAGESGERIEESEDPDADSSPSIGLLERAALSFGMSVALVPIFGFSVGTLWGFSRPIVLTSLTGVLLVGVVIAAVRRYQLPPDARYGVPVNGVTDELRWERLHPGGIGNAVLLVAILVAVGAMGFAVATPYQSGGSTALSLVTENETGAWTAAGYPTEFTAGESTTLAAGIKNDEERRQAYTIVVAVERVRTTDAGTSVVESSEITRLDPVVAAGSTWIGPHDVAPDISGDDLRLHYYLYKGETAPTDPDAASAYRDVYLWIDVGES